LEERNKRKTNLLIFNLEEENSGTQEEKRSKDNEKVQEIISKLKGKHQPKDIRRLGAPPRGDVNAEQTPRRPRPIRLTFQTELERDETLRAFKAVTRNRGDEDPNQSVKVSMRKDMTPQEREEDRALFFRAEAKERSVETGGRRPSNLGQKEGEDSQRGKVPTGQRRQMKEKTTNVHSFKGTKPERAEPCSATSNTHTCIYTNVDTLKNKKTELLVLVDLHKPSFIGITELKPKNSRFALQECELTIPGYELFHNLEKGHRGICLYIDSIFKPALCENLTNAFEEAIFVECKKGSGEHFMLGLIY
jgi:hypothetical protein